MDATYNEKITDAVAIVEAREETKDQTITFSTGVVVRLRKVNIFRINEINSQFKYPPIPETWDDNKERKTHNPEHPDYKKACAEIDTQRTFAILDAIAAFGTETLHVPEGVRREEDDEWIDECELVGIPVKRDSKAARHLAWMKYEAMKELSDLPLIAKEFGITMGIAEGAVADSISANFPD